MIRLFSIRCTIAAAFLSAAFVLPPSLQAQTPVSSLFEVKSFGAVGDGKTIDTAAINKAIDAAAAAGGGTVHFSPGTYASYSVHLKSNVTLYFEYGATLLAANPPMNGGSGAYDAPEASDVEKYQDFGHTHFRNSLIWGENIDNVTIAGPGTIFGKGLSRGQAPVDPLPGEPRPPEAEPIDPVTPAAPFGYPNSHDTLAAGIGNKAIALKNCRNIILRDVTIYHGGHFGVLATGVDNLTCDNLKIDTNRDGIDIDCCRNVHVSNCSVNSPRDDGICLKSSYGLGFARACENITITNCHVSGYDEGTMLDCTYQRKIPSTEAGGPTGRIKFGTESNGGYKNVVVSNCTFDYCRGLALEIVDGGWLEDVSISNLTMRDIQNASIFIRIGSRNRGPNNPPTGVVRRVNISNVVASGSDYRFGAVISGVPGHSIEGLSLSDIRILYNGGGTKEDAARQTPEIEKAYPEPDKFGIIPAYGFFLRHVKDLSMHHVTIGYATEDQRPAFMLDDVAGAEFDHIKAQHAAGVPTFVLKNVSNFRVADAVGLPDTHRDRAEADKF